MKYNKDGSLAYTLVDPEDTNPFGLYYYDGSVRVVDASSDGGFGVYAKNGALRVDLEQTDKLYNPTGALSLSVLGGSTPLDSDAAAYLARMSTPASGVQKAWTNTFFQDLKDAGVYSKLGLLYIPAQDQQAACLNLISTTGTLTPINAPTFTAFRGWSGDGATAYLTTGVQINQIPLWGQADAGFGGYFTEADPSSTTEGRIWGRSTSVGVFRLGKTEARLNGNSATSFVSPPTTRGMWSASRVNSTGQRVFINGVLNAVGASSSTTELTFTAFLLRISGLYATSAYRLGIAWAGAALSDTEQADMYTICTDLLTAIGAPTS